MFTFIRKNVPEIILSIFVLAYSIYFSLFTINRYEKLYAHYFDLGIMHQTVFNTYKALQTGDFSRILELTNPHDSASQVKRMAIHNDVLLALLAPFYFIHDGPETLLFIQAIGLAMGAVFVFLIGKIVLKKLPYSVWISLLFAISYLLYPPLHKANKFEFHPVTLATPLILGMYYFWLEKKYKTSFVFVVLSVFSKEHVGLITACFGGYIILEQYLREYIKWFSWKHLLHFLKSLSKHIKTNPEVRFGVITIFVSILWIGLSILIIPYFRGSEHFAQKYFDHIKENPLLIFTYPVRFSTLHYFTKLMGPVGFLSIFAPLQLFISAPEFAINLYSNNDNMRNTYFQYNSVINGIIFISAIYGFRFLYNYVTTKLKHAIKSNICLVICVILLGFTTVFTYLDSPLPYAKEKDMFPWRKPQARYYDVILWKKMLDDDKIKVSTTGRLAPHFTSRRYFYDFSWKYTYADYVVIEVNDAVNGFLKEKSAPAYAKLQSDRKYIKIYDENGIQVYKKI